MVQRGMMVFIVFSKVGLWILLKVIKLCIIVQNNANIVQIGFITRVISSLSSKKYNELILKFCFDFKRVSRERKNNTGKKEYAA